MLPTVEETRGYDFQDPDNVEKWRGVFINPLRKVLDHEHPTLSAEESALQYVESLCLRLLALLCAAPSPLTVQVLMDIFYQESSLVEAEGSAEKRGRRGSLSYSELVRDLLTDEKNFLRDLNLIIRVFKEELEKILDKDSRMISLIFGNIVDIYELTVTLLGNLEDAMEMSQDSPTPYIGSCFEELAEVEEFRAYVRYANIVTRKESRDALQNIVDDPTLSERLDTAGHGFRLAVKYYLPKLLMAPVAHVFLYHNYVLALLQIAPASEDRESFKQMSPGTEDRESFKQITPASEDRESFKQVECNLHPIKKLLIKALGNGPKLDATLRMASRVRRQIAIEKCNELARIVDNWDVRDIGQCCN
ncbi:hypothetical protein B5X24_HaOG214685, partial [Helicoverpa armigera]